MRKEYQRILDEMVNNEDVINESIDGRNLLMYLQLHEVLSYQETEVLIQMGPTGSIQHLMKIVLQSRNDEAMIHFLNSLHEANYDYAYNWLKEKLDNSVPTRLWKSGQSTGKTISPYKVMTVLGEGAFGKVYHATLGRESFALKKMSLKWLKGVKSREQRIQMFENEIKTLKTLVQKHHENIVQYKNCHGPEDGRDYVLIVMEYVNGGTIEDLWELRNELHDDLKIKIALGTCRGLAFLQEENIVHKDIKPANVLVANESYVAKISDFGLSEIKEQMSQLTSTDGGGTKLYQPPEILRFRCRDPAKSDVYSFAATVVTLWYKEQFRPKWYSKDNAIDIDTVMGSKETICACASCWTIVPDDIKNIIKGALHPHYSKRPSAKELLGEFEKLFSNCNLNSSSSSTSSASYLL